MNLKRLRDSDCLLIGLILVFDGWWILVIYHDYIGRLRSGSFWRDYLHGNGRDRDCELNRGCDLIHDDDYDRCHGHGMKTAIDLSILTCSLPVIDVTSSIIYHAQSAS